ncbi:MAG: response regulator [Oscillospiraceae bacterium]|jgi:two-component SAPR family response regulator|nr:response regulator [Oscillospiraceae bacterium]
MNIIAVDDEQHALKSLKSAIEEAIPNCTLSCFRTSKSALEYAKINRVDTAFLDIEMTGMNGLQFAKCLKDINGKTNIIFVTGHSRYAVDAIALRASGYIMKPATAQGVIEEVEYLRNTTTSFPLENIDDKNRIYVQTFGNFEVFADGKPLIFSRSKTKELLAYLVSRQGALCSNNEIVAVIWDDKADSSTLQSMFRALVADLTNTLKSINSHDILIKQRGFIGIIKEKITCDLYNFCAGIKVNRYFGEFMNQYSWAEFTNMYLDRMQEGIFNK